MIRQRGMALLEVIVVGFAVVLMTLPAISVVAKLTEANAVVHAVARDGAVWVARHGGDPPPVDGVTITMVETRDGVEVVATQSVGLVGVGGATIARTVRSTVRVAVSDYRSSP